jgi:hypothetical protein
MQGAVEVTPDQINLVVGLIIANAGFLVSAYVSLKVSNAKFEVKVDRLERDINNLGEMIREVKKNKEENSASIRSAS